MRPVDAEAHLRLAGERALLARRPGDPGFTHACVTATADALVTMGAMPVDRAQAVADSYAFALALRDPAFHYRDMMNRRRHLTRERPARRVGPQRVVRCDRILEQPWGSIRLRYVRLARDATTVHATVRGGGLWAPAGGAGSGGAPWGTGPLEVPASDDRGTEATASFSGGGSGPLTGWFQVSPPLAPRAGWLTFAGERVPLTDEVPAPETSVEALPGEDRAPEYLWQRVADLAQQPDAPAILEVVLDALGACGALTPGDRAADDARMVLAAFRHRGEQGQAPGKALPGPWSRLLGRRSVNHGPDGEVAMAALTPPIDGVTVLMWGLTSGAGSFVADVEVSPDLGLPGDLIGHPRLTWWAADDLGNPYLGHPRSWHLREDRDHGQIEFRPALDPSARLIVLMPSALNSRAVIRVPLVWVEGP